MIFLQLQNYHFLQRLEGSPVAAIVANLFIGKLQILCSVPFGFWLCLRFHTFSSLSHHLTPCCQSFQCSNLPFLFPEHTCLLGVSAFSHITLSKIPLSFALTSLYTSVCL